MIIDFHTHIFPDKMAAGAIAGLEARSGLTASCDGTRAGLIRSMDEAGIDLSVVLPVVTAPRQFAGINRFAEETNREYGNRLLSFGGIHPDSPDYRKELRCLAEQEFCGIKLHPAYQETDFNDIRYKRIVSFAMELGMVVTVHAGVDIGLPEPVRCTPAMAKEVLLDTGADRLVLAHYGGWKQWDEVEELLAGTDCYLDTSFAHPYIGDEQFLRILERHGGKKILFATDCPWSGQKETAAWIMGLGLPEEWEDDIFSGNALRLLRRA